ncbi:MAG: hypothetical protein LBS27_06410 [Bifidobacteriaceae bacterium]|jgi:hypothetical protein|nr:hypothetical protein [Bifidobacteriaceae bacterium]
MSDAEFALIARLAEAAKSFAVSKTAETVDTDSPLPTSDDTTVPDWRRVDPELTCIIAADYRDGLTQAGIAVKRGVHVQTVKRHLAKGGQTIRSRKAELAPSQLTEASGRRAPLGRR